MTIMKTLKELIDIKEMEIISDDDLKKLKGGVIVIEDITIH